MYRNDTAKENRAAEQRDSLLGVIEHGESSITEFISYFNEVERNLDSVTAKQHIILSGSGKSDMKLKKERIKDEIKAINRLMELNGKKIKELNHKFSLVEHKNAELEKTIQTLNNQLALKYLELVLLNETLKDLSDEVAEYKITVDTLMLRNAILTETIQAKSSEMRTAYYIVATSKDLQQWNLVDKMGGLLGIGQTAKVSNNLDMNMFTKIDCLETTTIPINSKGIKVISTHPTGSFSLDKTGKMVNSLVISDPEKFWSVSKYLVISK